MMGIAQKISRDFTDAVRSRGQSYFAKGRVVITGASAGEVVARVRGTAKYRVRLRLRNGKLHASCTCPYFSPAGDPCKHLWATILMVDARGLLQSAPVRRSSSSATLPVARRLPPTTMGRILIPTPIIPILTPPRRPSLRASAGSRPWSR